MSRPLIKKTLNVVGFMSLMILAEKGFAASATTPLVVSATVSAVCSISASPLVFGTFNPLSGAPLDNTTTLSVTCTNGTSYNVGLDTGLGSGASVSSRKMTRTSGGTQTIDYTLYQDSGHTTVWGNTIGSDTVAGTGTGSSQSLTIYGRIFASQTASPPVASYQDTVTASVNY